MSSSTSKILFDKFEILDTLKKDQQTTVYLANHIYLGKKIILKTLAEDELPDNTFLDRFKREAKILAQLDHENIIKILDFGTAANSFYISFEYFESKNLRKVIKENNLSEDEKINLCAQLFLALNAAHKIGIIHRDIKPENILVNSNLELKIADFGLAWTRDELTLTQKSSIVGTPGYMSPEQIRGEELTPQTDLFSSGVVIYELFTGINPLIGKDINETINNILNSKIEKDFHGISSLPSNVQNALQNLLRKNFSQRTKSALEAMDYFYVKEEVKSETNLQPVRKKSKNSFYYWMAGIFFIAIASYLIINNFSDKKNIPVSDEKDGLIFSDSVQKKENTNNISEAKKNEENLVIPQNEKLVDEPANTLKTSSYGKLFVEANPWAEVLIDNKKVDTTPLEDVIELEEGEYEIKLMHPDFPVYNEKIEIKPDELKTVKIDFNEKVGFLECRIFPWGEVYINGKYVNTTPLRKPILLMPGIYILKIHNLGFPDIEQKITIRARDTLTFKYDFEETDN